MNDAPTTQQVRGVAIVKDRRSAEPLVNLSKYGISGENFYARTDGANLPYGRRIDGAIAELLARQSVAEKLVEVNAALAAEGVELFVLDAYRPVACQKGLWNFMTSVVKSEHPRLSPAELDDLTATYVFDPRRFDEGDPTTWPLHSTGGAVDVLLREQQGGGRLEFGADFDEPTARSHTDYLERELAAGRIGASDGHLLNRRVLYWAMSSAGFVNYPYEYWHYDFGTQMYAAVARHLGMAPPPEAFYGYARL